jgi:hypothetical protein
MAGSLFWYLNGARGALAFDDERSHPWRCRGGSGWTCLTIHGQAFDRPRGNAAQAACLTQTGR